ncbi:hypothetical protein PVAP13_2NG377900 [Panicum virgatum]|uniref:Uncharacterized protein n=1 Tax=Panicum virgatum TaxID=38727 RepID=A0A8T0VRA1_PANVG|nr:hypothetical protein PVAP13_2NG377900 [Panicum virgatum]
MLNRSHQIRTVSTESSGHLTDTAKSSQMTLQIIKWNKYSVMKKEASTKILPILQL